MWQDSIYLPTGTPGAVVEQHPPAGSSVKVGRNILLTTHRITPERGGVLPRGARCQARGAHFDHRGFEFRWRRSPTSCWWARSSASSTRAKRWIPKRASPRAQVGSGGRGAGLQRRPCPLAFRLVLARRRCSAGTSEACAGPRGLRARRADRSGFCLAVVASQDIVPSETPYVARRHGNRLVLLTFDDVPMHTIFF